MSVQEYIDKHGLSKKAGDSHVIPRRQRRTCCAHERVDEAWTRQVQEQPLQRRLKRKGRHERAGVHRQARLVQEGGRRGQCVRQSQARRTVGVHGGLPVQDHATGDHQGGGSPDLRFARESHRGMRRDHLQRHLPCSRAQRSLYRCLRSGGTARWRQEELHGQVRVQGRGKRQHDDRTRSHRQGSHPTEGTGRAHDQARRHRQQGEARGQRHPCRVHGRGQGRSRRERSAPVPAPGRSCGEHQAGSSRAFFQHHQRWVACWKQPGHAGIHDPTHGGFLLCGSHEDGERGVSQPQVRDQGQVWPGRVQCRR
mmetsp:Transcript_5571/g.34544  ORF Transcript_5571/g.34544 Transcript_5571/m.34544 type:complete len:310 (-) Transcript_5571:2152-3081(-)